MITIKMKRVIELERYSGIASVTDDLVSGVFHRSYDNTDQ